MACVDIPALPLQLLLRRHPGWRGQPTVVVDRDHPQGRILWVDELARRQRVLPGMRYAAALSHCGDLRAAEVPAAVVERAVEALVRLFWRFSPGVEVVEKGGALSDEPSGTFWLDASGLVSGPDASGDAGSRETEGLYPSLTHWAALLRATLASRELDASIVVGFRKFASYAVARAAREDDARIRVFDDPEDEQEAARRVPLSRLAIAPKARDLLGKLGVRSIGDLVRLPADGVERRFRNEVWQLYRLARGELEAPFEPRLPIASVEREVELGYVEKDTARLLVVIERELPPLLEQLARGDRALACIEVTLFLEDGEPHRECLRTAAPTLDAPRILELLRLRFESLGTRLGERLAQRFGRGRKRVAGITDLKLRVEGACASREQLELFCDRSVRDLRAGDRALARLRAEFGESAVVAACSRDGHLPEAGFVWKSLEKVAASQGVSQGASQGASPSDRQRGQLVRRLYARPHPLPPRPRHEPDGWMLRGLEQGPVASILGPYIVSGGWWRRRVVREYHFAETQKGEVLWVYYDRPRRRWFVQGRVE